MKTKTPEPQAGYIAVSELEKWCEKKIESEYLSKPSIVPQSILPASDLLDFAKSIVSKQQQDKGNE